jgi:hypothetical protein
LGGSSIHSYAGHLDLHAVLPGLWQSRLSKAVAERGRQVVTLDGEPMWEGSDGVLGRSGPPGGAVQFIPHLPEGEDLVKS